MVTVICTVFHNYEDFLKKNKIIYTYLYRIMFEISILLVIMTCDCIIVSFRYSAE